MTGRHALLLLALAACTSAPPTPDTDVADSAVDTDPPADAPVTLAELDDADLVLSEVMLAPVACPYSHYLELEYRGEVVADLSGLIVSSSTESRTLPGPIVARPGDHLVLARESSAVTGCYNVAVAAAYGLDLDPDADALTIGDGALRLFAQVDLSSLPHTPGAATQRDEDDAWCLATSPIHGTTDQGTPGQANGPCAPPDTDPPNDTDTAAPTPGVDTLHPGDLQITEFMANPTAGDDTVLEFVEVRNTTDAAVDLHGLELQDASTVTSRVSEHAIVGAGQRALLVRDIASFVATYGVTADGVEGLGLNNDGDLVRLSNALGVLDEVDFRGWHATAGASMQRDESGAWCASTDSLGGTADKGTPGAANPPCPASPDTDAPADTDVGPDTDLASDTDTAVDTDAIDTDAAVDTDLAPLTLRELAPGDLRVVELMADPSACADPSGEYVELWVRTRRPVDLAGLVLADAVTHKSFPGAYVAQPNDRVVLFMRGSSNCYGLVGLAYSGLTLNNAGGDHLQVEDGAGRALDALDYSTWPLTAGRSWEQDFSGAWCLGDGAIGSTGDQGSPGAPNGPCPGTDTGGVDTDTPAGPVGVDTAADTGDTGSAPPAR